MLGSDKRANYEELDDYLLTLKARHKPEFRIQVLPVINAPDVA